MDPTTGTGPGDMEVEEGAGVAQFDFESESGEGVEEQLATIAPPALLQAAAAAPRPTPLMTTLPEAARLAVHSRNTSCVLRIAPEERRGTASQTETACARLAAEHRVKIERSTNKDQWLTLIISGAPPPPLSERPPSPSRSRCRFPVQRCTTLVRWFTCALYR